MLSLHAVQIEPEEVRYRINSAMVAMAQQDPDNALNILRATLPIAKTGGDIAVVTYEIQRVQRYKDELERAHNFEKSRPNSDAEVETHTNSVSSTTDTGPEVHYPDAPPTGPHHTARGVLRAVRCSYPTVLTLTVDHRGNPVSLYSNNYYKIPFQHPQLCPHRRPRPLQGNRRHEGLGRVHRRHRPTCRRPDRLDRAE